MKKRLLIFVATLLCLVPFVVDAKKYMGKEYKTLNYTETLEDEAMDKLFTDYKESDDKITIYLFRGHGCQYCRAFLTFMNEITEEYGKYFNMVTFEVWNNSSNSKMMDKVSEFLDEPAGGVPYIIIGSEVFPGYASSYNDAIKEAIVNLYNTPKNKRYDAFAAMEKYEKSQISNKEVVLWNLVFTTIGTLVVVFYVNKKYTKLISEIKKNNYHQSEYRPSQNIKKNFKPKNKNVRPNTNTNVNNKKIEKKAE